MADSPPPAFQLYPRDILASCAGMSNEAFGAYMRLLLHAWSPPRAANGSRPPIGHLPNEPRLLAELSQVGPRWPKIADQVLRHFRKSEDGAELINDRMVQEREKQEQYSAAMRANGAKGGRPRKNPRLSDGFPAAKPQDSRLKAEKSTASASASAIAPAELEKPLSRADACADTRAISTAPSAEQRFLAVWHDATRNKAGGNPSDNLEAWRRIAELAEQRRQEPDAFGRQLVAAYLAELEAARQARRHHGAPTVADFVRGPRDNPGSWLARALQRLDGGPDGAPLPPVQQRGGVLGMVPPAPGPAVVGEEVSVRDPRYKLAPNGDGFFPGYAPPLAELLAQRAKEGK